MAIILTQKALDAALEALRSDMEDGFVALTKEFAEDNQSQFVRIAALESENLSLKEKLRLLQKENDDLSIRFNRFCKSLTRNNPRDLGRHLRSKSV